MRKKGSWLSSIKKALSPSSKEKKRQKSKTKGFEAEKSSVPDASTAEPVSGSRDFHPLLEQEEVKPIEVEDELAKHAYSVAAATAAAAEAAAAAAQAAAETVRLAELTRYSGKSREEVATIKIQTAFRGYLARRALQALRGLVRLKTLVEGSTVKRQTINTLKCMQNVSRVQSQINSRRIRMSEENQALQRQLLQKQAKEIESLQAGDEWNDSVQSKEQIEAKLLSKYEATMRRERAMAYSFSHQQPWKKSTRTTNLLFMDPTNPQWGWSWLERYMAARPWEARAEKDGGNEIAKSYARHQLNSTPSTPRAKALASRSLKPGLKGFGPDSVLGPGPDDDVKSVFSVQSERNNRRHSISGSSVRDDESLASSLSVPSYMAPTRSTKARSRQSPLGPVENDLGPGLENGLGSVGNVKKRLSFPASTAGPRRHSGPPRVESSILIGLEQN